MKNPIYINDSAYVSAIDSFKNQETQTFFDKKDGDIISPLSEHQNKLLQSFLETNKKFRNLDRSVQLALLAADSLKNIPEKTAINIGSSRGATGLWESYFSRFRESEFIPTVTSPLTTLGNISTWVAQFLGTTDMAFSHSITCATASHAILNAVAWLESGMAASFIAGGSEAPLTEFTIAQMQALRIYSNDGSKFPCRALDTDKMQNTMILGEAAALFLLSKQDDNSVARITGYGSAIEPLSSATSVSKNGQCLQDAMKQAMGQINPESIDVIITHAPGTVKGDLAELTAIKAIFGQEYPHLCNNKWQLGHTLGASSALNLAMAIEMFKEQKVFKIPYLKETFLNSDTINCYHFIKNCKEYLLTDSFTHYGNSSIFESHILCVII